MTGPSLAERVGIETDERRQRGDEVTAEIGRRGLHSVRLAFADAHGLLRGKTLRADLVTAAMADGLGITSALLMKDTGQLNVYPVWASGGGLDKPWLTGAGDVMMLPDPTTFRVLPWTDGTGWLLCDLVSPAGEPVELSTRAICAGAERAIADDGLRFVAGLEIEFHLYRVLGHGDDRANRVGEPRAPAQSLDLANTHPGRVYLGEQRFDGIEPFLEPLRDGLSALGLAPRSLEVELGPSQVELTFSPGGGLEVADQAVLIRSAVKQLATRHGLHATFLARPNFPGAFSSGWHLHQSLVDAATGDNIFVPGAMSGPNPNPGDGEAMLSERGRHYAAGLLSTAAASCLLTTPTVTGYKRYRPQSLAPDRVAWGAQHRGAMLRVVGTGGDPATRIENRVGDSAANPYLYLASQMLAGRHGLRTGDEPPPPTETPYEPEAGERLPRNLGDAIEAFSASGFHRRALGDEFVDYLSTLKRAEWNRFLATVTDWEQNEYLELF